MSKYFLFISLLTGMLLNLDNPILRFIAILLWSLPPVMLVISNLHNIRMINREVNELFFVIFMMTSLFLCWLYNNDTLEIGVSGVYAEMLTPFLYIVNFFTLVSLRFLITKDEISEKFLFNFILFFIIFVYIDMVCRYIEAPQLFLNYDERFQAKNTGFFSNTNVLGQSLAFLIIIINLLNIRFKLLFQLLLMIVLISTMARSAILAVILVYGISVFWERGRIYRCLAIIICCLSLIYFMMSDFVHDGSFLSKIEFVDATTSLIVKSDISDIIFGFGASFDVITSKLDVRGYSPHLSILKAFLYYGLVGVSFFIFYLYRMYKLNNRFIYPIITFLIFGLAGAPIYWPALTTGLALILINDHIGNRK